MSIQGIVLAAGRGRRMGRPKHLLPVGVPGVPMLVRVVRALGAAPIGGLTVVLRPGDDDGVRCAAELGVAHVYAEASEEGRAASVRAGVRGSSADAGGWLFALADQPLLETADFAALIAAWAAEPRRIVAARYGEDRGSPVLFGASFRDELLALRGSEGGRTVLRAHLSAVVEVALAPERGRDVDSPEDLLALSPPRS